MESKGSHLLERDEEKKKLRAWAAEANYQGKEFLAAEAVKNKALLKAAERYLARALAFATLSAMLSCNIGTACPNFYVATSLDARTY